MTAPSELLYETGSGKFYSNHSIFGILRDPQMAKNQMHAIRQAVLLTLEPSNIGRDRAEMSVNAVLEREATRTSAIGGGLAVPHSKTAAVDRPYVGIFRSMFPIDFQSIDGRPVTLIGVWISPPDATHIHFLARLSRLITLKAWQSLFAKSGPQSADELRVAIEQMTQS